MNKQVLIQVSLSCVCASHLCMPGFDLQHTRFAQTPVESEARLDTTQRERVLTAVLPHHVNRHLKERFIQTPPYTCSKKNMAAHNNNEHEKDKPLFLQIE